MALRQVVIMLDLRKHFDRQVAAGIGHFAHAATNWSLILRDEHLVRVSDPTIWPGDGIIVDLDDQRFVNLLHNLCVPIVGIGGYAEHLLVEPSFPYVAVNNCAVGIMAAEHLLHCGHENFAYCGLPATRHHSWAAARGQAFAECVRNAGHFCAVYAGRHRTMRFWKPMLKDLAAWLERLPKPVGVLACDDSRARHVLEACRSLGLRMPQDVAVLGVDNDAMICEMSAPSLSSVDLSATEIGFNAAKTLDRLMRGRKASVWQQVAPRAVVLRESTDVIATSDPVVAKALEQIRSRPTAILDPSQLARELGTSRSTLERHFRRYLGATVHGEIERVRLDIAKRLLATTDLSVEHVAKRSGFNGSGYLGFVFRRTMQLSPREYRQQTRRGRTNYENPISSGKRAAASQRRP